MGNSSAAPQSTPHTLKGGDSSSSTNSQSAAQRTTFVVMALNMSWQLALVVLIPVIGGVRLDKALDMSNTLLFVGLAIALAGSIIVMWRTMQAANRLPVPKLTAAQKREIQKQYEEDDADA